jgi:hypothetical protein
MSQLLKFNLAKGGNPIYIEVEETASKGQVPVGIGDKLASSAKAVLDIGDSIGDFANRIVDNIRNKVSDANEISIEFGVKMSADLGVIIAKSQLEANFKVAISWKK